MIALEALEGMEPAALREWVSARVREEVADPPLRAIHMESPEDFILTSHEATTQVAFRRRLEQAVVEVLNDLARQPDLTSGPDAKGVAHLAAIAQHLALRPASAALRAIALRGRMGGEGTALDLSIERAVLAALSVVQEPAVLRDQWLALWKDDDPKGWAVALAGLRRSDPRVALALLGSIVRRARLQPELPLGEALWAFRADPDIGEEQLAEALARLDAGSRDACRSALESVGATTEQVGRLLDPAPTQASRGRGARTKLPAWAHSRNAPSQVPRMAEEDVA